MGRGHGPEPAPQAAYRSKVWGLIDNEFPEEEDSSDIIADDEQSNDMPAHTSSFKHPEQPFNNCPGGLHPVHLWDSLDCGRYRVIHKLGYETSSTIWLARDSDHDAYVAIKILTAKTSKHRNELGCLHYLSKKPSTHPGRKYVVASFLDRHFWLKGPNGRQLALVHIKSIWNQCLTDDRLAHQNPRKPGTKNCPAVNTRVSIPSFRGNLSWESHWLECTVLAH